MNIDRKKGKENAVLVWGGSCTYFIPTLLNLHLTLPSASVGLYTIQLAALHNFKIIATCSPRNFDLVKSSGATHVFDYSDPSVVSKISEAEPNFQYVFDTIGDKNSSGIASQAIRKEGGGLCTVRPGKANCENVTKQTKVTDVLVWTAFLKEHWYGDFHWPPHKEDHELASELFEKLPELLESGKVRPNPTRIKKGLDAVAEGFQEYRDGKISAYKIVYEL